MDAPRVRVLKRDEPADSAHDCEAVVTDDVGACAELARRRGAACAVGGLPVLVIGASFLIDDESESFGSLDFLEADAAILTVQAATAALSFRQRAAQAAHRLHLLLAALGLIVTGLLGLGVYLLSVPLPPAPVDSQREALAYDEYRRQFQWSRMGPAECRSEAEFAELAAALAGPLAPPAEFAKAWQDTPPAVLFRKWQTDATLSTQYRETLAEWYRNQSRRGAELLDAPRYNEAWIQAVRSLLLEVVPLPMLGDVPESPRLPQRRGKPLNFTSIHSSDFVEQAEVEWAATAWRLTAWPQMKLLLLSIAHQTGMWLPWS